MSAWKWFHTQLIIKFSALPETFIHLSKGTSLPNVLCGATLGVAFCHLQFAMSSPWQHAEKGCCLPLRWCPGGEKINRLRIQCPHGHLSLCWPWPLPLIIPVVIKCSNPLWHLWKYIHSIILYCTILDYVSEDVIFHCHCISDDNLQC